MPNCLREIQICALVGLVLLLDACGEPGPGTSDGATSTSASETEGGTTTGEPDSTQTSGEPATTAPATTAPATTAGSGCSATDPRIGWRAVLVEKYHGVAGTAEIIDDCTIIVTGFSYDGSGLDVRFYGARDEDYGAGFALSDNLLRSGGYAGETMVLTLPAEHTLGALEGLSVWCVEVEIDFGSGVFTAP